MHACMTRLDDTWYKLWARRTLPWKEENYTLLELNHTQCKWFKIEIDAHDTSSYATCLCIVFVLTCVDNSWVDLPNIPEDEGGDYNLWRFTRWLLLDQNNLIVRLFQAHFMIL